MSASRPSAFTEPEHFLYGAEEEEPEPLCGPMAHLHRMGGASGGSDSSQEPPNSPQPETQMHEDMETGGSGSESHGNESHGNESVGSSSGNGKDSAIMASSGSNKSSSNSPPSSNNAFSLVSSEQDHPSTSGCSSEESAKAKTQKEVSKMLKELKYHLPPDTRSKGRSSTLHALRHALRCVKQVKANEEYYQMLMINDSQPSGLDVSSYTIEEINSITSEYTLKNPDIFAVAVSLITGKIVYISDQAAGILHCRKEEFKDRKFVEFLTPRDVSVFYSFTTPYRLPSWSVCTGTESSSTEFMQEKSFFCRISGGKEKESDLQYYPFRMTPYLMKVQEPELSEEHFCTLILAERVHSGYEAPRIPADKRIFTTTHTPNCVFQDVDERTVPLLGYLPQDLIGTPLLLHLHPSDRPVMLAVHRKILQHVGQPIDQSSVRFCLRNGEYVTLDTSWCSFVNPWSRKVSFVIGRHTVRMGPVNEDVFSAPGFSEEKVMDPDIQEITEQIHRLLLQPVHSVGSSGYGSNASHEQLLSIASSSDSAGTVPRSLKPGRTEDETRSKPRTFQEICKGVHMMKAQEQLAKPEQKKLPDTGVKALGGGAASVEKTYSYQQISCLDSVIRYLESCNVPNTVKRKYQFSSNTTSSNSDEDGRDAHTEGKCGVKALSPLELLSKADSVVSQCSYSSTIVHVGDKKTETIEDQAESPAAPVSLSSSAEQEVYRKLGLTKQVLAAHTQKEEQAFLSRCRELRRTQSKHSHTPARLHTPRTHNTDAGGLKDASDPKTSGKKCWRSRKCKKPRRKYRDRSEHRLPPLQGLNQTSWSPSETSQSAPPLLAGAAPSAPPYPAPLVTPVVAFVLPGFVMPQVGGASVFPGQQAFSITQPFPTAFPYPPTSDPKPATPEQSPSPPLFESRCSSPLQLDLLQLEDKQETHHTAPPCATPSAPQNTHTSADAPLQACGWVSDGSSSSSVVELLMQEDSGSATSHSAAGSRTSKCFGSVDSSEKVEDQRVTMTYQVPSRDAAKVLDEDRERLRRMQKNQPRFSSEQRRELIDQHPWMRRGGLPNAIDVTECMYCEDYVSALPDDDDDEEEEERATARTFQ